MPATPTNPGYYNDFERVSFSPRASSLQRLLWGLSHGLLGVSFGFLRPGWGFGLALLIGLLGHAWHRWPQPAPPFQLGSDGKFWLGATSPQGHRLRRAELGPWHVYVVLEGTGPITRLCIYKDAMDAPAWAALRRRLLVTDNIG
jgi:hypothetical protein